MSFAHRVSTQFASTTTRSISNKKSVKPVSSRKSVGVRAVITEPVASSENKAAYDDFSDMLNDYLVDYKVGDKIMGKVSAMNTKGAYVDIGGKAPALCPTVECSLASVRNAAAVFDEGQEYEFEIVKGDDGEGSMTLSVRKIQLEEAWERCRQAQADDLALSSEVLSANRGGILVEVESLRGFIPQSHLAPRLALGDRDELIGQTLPVKFIEVDEEKNRLVASHRLATDLVSGEGLDVGDVINGIVQAVKPYGAFVDVGGQSGLLHISQISHERIVAVENVLSPGDELKVLILSKDKERGRLSLSTKKLEPNHGDMLRNPSLVYEKAEEMGKLFRERVAAAEAAAEGGSPTDEVVASSDE
mmetsp:Transcript_7807/g.23224  ORF Transcript_7807/g.23224 Transcript_7807/m.23224 type:complete len:360 (-) Transcript_7807:98-1177(-)